MSFGKKDDGCGCSEGCDQPRGHNSGQPVFDPTPDAEVITQYDPKDYPILPVRIDGIVPVRNLPARYSSMSSQVMSTTTPVQVANPDPRIARITIVGSGDAWLGKKADLTNANGPYGFYLPGLVPVVFEGITDEIWALAPFSTPHISWREEYWAD